MDQPYTRRELLKTTAAGIAGASLALQNQPPSAPVPGERPARRPEGVTVLNPRGRVPVSLIIDDSTCLVNLAHFCIPQFHEVFPDRYPQPWQTLPREIPDAFVRNFAAWCREHGLKGKYSVIPYPACVGWLDRELPGWWKKDLDASLELVRTVLAPDWDFHTEMVSHTWVIDTKSGRSYPERSDRFMENWRWTDGRSVDEIADYMTYALRILKNVGIRCEGITTPGGFGNRALAELSQATLQSCRAVFQAEIPHYFRHLFTDERSVAPRVEYASGLEGADPKCAVSIIGCTGDWFGGWDGLTPGSADRLITEDMKGGRMPEVIRRGEPAIMVCHWPGIYFNGQEVGFNVLKEVVRRLEAGFENLVWMRLSEIARYWAARELTRIERRGAPEGAPVSFHAPFACPQFTVSLSAPPGGPEGTVPRLAVKGQQGALRAPLREVGKPLQLQSGTWCRDGKAVMVCFDLPKGDSLLDAGAAGG
jgi:hypothetical protein